MTKQPIYTTRRWSPMGLGRLGRLGGLRLRGLATWRGDMIIDGEISMIMILMICIYICDDMIMINNDINDINDWYLRLMKLMILMILILYYRSIEREVLRYIMIYVYIHYIYIQTVRLFLGHQSTYGWAGFSHAWNMNLQQEANQYVEWFLEFRWKDETIGENHVNLQLGKALRVVSSELIIRSEVIHIALSAPWRWICKPFEAPPEMCEAFCKFDENSKWNWNLMESLCRPLVECQRYRCSMIFSLF